MSTPTRGYRRAAWWKQLRLGSLSEEAEGYRLRVNPAAIRPTFGGDRSAIQERGASVSFEMRILTELRAGVGDDNEEADPVLFRRRIIDFLSSLAVKATYGQGNGDDFSTRGLLAIVYDDAEYQATAPGGIAAGESSSVQLSTAPAWMAEGEILYVFDGTKAGIGEVESWTPGTMMAQIKTDAAGYAAPTTIIRAESFLPDSYLSGDVELRGMKNIRRVEPLELSFQSVKLPVYGVTP